MAPDFEPERYADEYRERALAMIEKKVEGQEIKAVAPAPRRTGQVVDIFAALKKSLESAGQQKATAERGKRKRKGLGRRTWAITRFLLLKTMPIIEK